MKSGLLALLLLAVPQEATDKPAPRKRPYEPGQLSDDAKKKTFEELSARTRRELKGAAKAAAARRKEWLEGLEKDYGIYDVATLLDTGDSARRVDIVIVSAGFGRSEAAKVQAMAESLKSGLLKVDPFHTYAAYLNVHRICIADAGPASAHIPYRVANGFLNCDTRKAMEIAEQAPAADLVVVLCNVGACRATASGPVIAIDAGVDLGRAFLHEMGHAFAGLADEYVEPGNEKNASPPFTPDQEESTPNVTTLGLPKFLKWHYWIPEVWATAHAPNKLPAGHKVGAFEGAGLFGRGAYRPETACLMQNGDRYCVVCFEQVEKQFFRLIPPIDDARPRAQRIGLWLDDSATFEADVIQTQGGGKAIGDFRGLWYVDFRSRHPTQAKNLTTSLTLQAQDLGEGVHDVALRVDFSNSRVRRDHGWLSGTRSWSVVVSKHKRPKIDAPAAVKGAPGQALDFDVTIGNPDPERFRVEATGLPEGAAFKDGHVSWTPTKAQQGGWRPRFTLGNGVLSVSREVEISVLDPGEKRNYPPLLLPMEPVSASVNETLELPLDAVDVDGDNLVFTGLGLPEGAELDLYEGLLRWKPSKAQVGRHVLTVEMADGTSRSKGALEVVVEENATLRRDPGAVPAQLRSPEARTRAEALRKAGPFGRSFRLLEAGRLLRDRNAMVRGSALDVLRALSDTDNEALLGMMVKDLAPHAWAFTDDPESLAWLGTLASKGKGEKGDVEALKISLKQIEKYNRDRGAGK